MTETRPIPAIAKTAHDLLTAQYQQDLSSIGGQTVAVLGLDPALKWTVDFPAGVVRRELPEAPDVIESPPDAPPDASPGV